MDLNGKRIKFSIITLGCKVNQYESEAIKQVLSDMGHISCDPGRMSLKNLSPQTAPDVYIINTCTVTRKAAMQSRQAIRQAVRSNPEALVIVTGCYAQTRPEAVAQIPGVDLVAGHREKGHIPDLVFSSSTQGDPPAKISVGDIRQESFFQDMPATPTGTRTRPFLKIQDGCNARCSYCIVPHARGKSRSMPPEQVLDKIREFAHKGYHETVLTGIHLGAYGQDLSSQTGLYELLTQIRDLDLIDRVRLSSIEPRELTDRIIDLAAGWEGLCPHFHIPLQSGDNDILKKMNRPYEREFLHDLVLRIHDNLPHAAIGIDCLVGFPGETEKAFRGTFDLIESIPASYLHVFPFSPREGTPAWDYPEKVGDSQIRERCRVMRSLGHEKKKRFFETFVGKPISALVEWNREPSTGLLKAMSSNYIPVLLEGPDPLKNSIQTVTLTGVSENLMARGKLLQEQAAGARAGARAGAGGWTG